MFDPRQQRMMGGPGGQPMQRPGWAQQLGQGLAAQQPQWGQPMPQGGPPPGVRMGPPQGGMPPQAAGPDGRPMMPPPPGLPGAGFMRDSDQAVRQALMRSRGRPPVMPEGGPQGGGPTEAPQPQTNAEGGDLQEDPRKMMMQGGGGYR